MARGKTEAEARERVDTVDQERRDFIQKYFGVEWPNLPLYHALLNTAIGEEMVVEAVLALMNTFNLSAEGPAPLCDPVPSR